ncbi:MAG: hypothetical protein A3H27_06005 [Acidobacteria bacterium RIFCSPLOWO2_02_FULL_59_13]|nr:MAG: hypothetical protein A3H27_06005 [Acidobacteria bacterium RIFCSPLOWO2_02_FULL_59_13]
MGADRGLNRLADPVVHYHQRTRTRIEHQGSAILGNPESGPVVLARPYSLQRSVKAISDRKIKPTPKPGPPAGVLQSDVDYRPAEDFKKILCEDCAMVKNLLKTAGLAPK